MDNPEDIDKPTEEEVLAFLEGITYPATRQEVVDWVAQQGADDNTIAVLEKVPDRPFENQDDIADSLADVGLVSQEDAGESLS